MVHEELKLRITVDTSDVEEAIARIRQEVTENPLPRTVKLVVRIDTEASTERIKNMAVALSAAQRQIDNLERRLGLAQNKLTSLRKKAPKRLPKEKP